MKSDEPKSAKRLKVSSFLLQWGSKRGAMSALAFPLLLACSRAQVAPESLSASSPVSAVETLCASENSVQQVQGRAWFRVEQGSDSSSFPAMIRSVRGSSPSGDRTSLEITNLIGATELVVQIQGDQITFEGPAIDSRTQKEAIHSGSWNGIPIAWVGRLLRGAVPCPDAWDSYRVEKDPLSSGSDLLLTAFGPKDQMSWRAALQSGGDWQVNEFIWKSAEGVQPSLRVTRAEFDEHRHPKRLDLLTSQGKVSIRWRERDVVR